VDKDPEKVSSTSVLDHVYVPKHELVSEREKKGVLEKWHATPEELPYILATDPAVKEIGATLGDLIRITRKSPTSKETVYYRFVVER